MKGAFGSVERLLSEGFATGFHMLVEIFVEMQEN